MTRVFERRDGKPFALEGGPVNLGIAVDVERKDGSHSLMVPAIKGADGLDFAAFHSYYEDLITKTRESKLTADDFQGTNISLTNPGGIGTVASVPAPDERPERDRRHRRDRLPARVGARHARPPAPARRLQDDDADLDLRPPRHPGRRVGRLPAQHRAAAAGRGRLLRGRRRRPRHRRRRRSPPPTPPRPRRRRSALRRRHGETAVTATQPDEELLQAVQAATSLLKGYRTHGHLAARLDPLGREPKGDPALAAGEPQPDARS